MNLKVVEFNHALFAELEEFCRKEAGKDPASTNMWTPDWKNNQSSLLFILQNTKRFESPNGVFHLIYDGNDIIGCGGVYRTDFDKNIALAGVRSWLASEYRTKQIIRNHLLIAHKRWARRNAIKIIGLSFNQYNKNLLHIFERGQRFRTRTPLHMFSSNFTVVEHLVMIQNVPQWVIFEQLDAYQFDWSKLKAE